MSYLTTHFEETRQVLEQLNINKIEQIVKIIANTHDQGGRLFFLGVGGSAANASHAVNDFRKICGIEAYAPTDNVSELTARTNDEGWDTAYVNWLKGCNLCDKDIIFVFSVGGGNVEKNISVNIVSSLEYGKKVGAKVVGIVGRDGGYTKKVGDNVILVPTIDKKLVTPYSESFHSVIWHCLVSHPILQKKKMKW